MTDARKTAEHGSKIAKGKKQKKIRDNQRKWEKKSARWGSANRSGKVTGTRSNSMNHFEKITTAR